MGRVDEAMRRAVSSPVDGDEAAAALIGEEPRVETFPSEAPDAPRVRSIRSRSWTAADETSAPVAPAEPPASLLDRMAPAMSRKTVVDREIDPISREQYRRLATGLHARQAADGLKVIAVVSAVASEGKSLTAANLALTLSESYQRSVLLIDGDLRRPSIETVFGLPPGNGLTEGLLGTAGDQPLTLHRVSPHLTVLSAGRPTTDPMAALASERMSQLLEEARSTFDWVIVDTPPVALLSDASLMADSSDGVLLVVKAHGTPYDVVQRAVDAIGRDRILGVVLNQATDLGPASEYQAYYQTATSQPPVKS